MGFSSPDVRLALPKDLSGLAAIERAAAQSFPEEALPLKNRQETLEKERLQAGQEEGRLAVACRNGVPVGFALVERLPGLALLAEMDVHPAHARQGLGTALAQWAIGWARQAGFSQLGLTTFQDLPWNAPFYRKLGFRALAPEETPRHLKLCLEEESLAGLMGRVAMLLRL